jgi:RNA polymerase sigma-70 factor, ECF subfamily
MSNTPPTNSPDKRIDDPDLELVRQAQGGDFSAFETLVSRYEGRVYKLGLRILGQAADAEEAAQNTFVSLVEHLGDFRGEAPFRTWLLRIAANAALKLLRQRRAHPTVGLEVTDEDAPHPEFIAPWQDDVPTLAGRAEVRQLLAAALAELDEKYRVVFVLRDMEGLTTEETAKNLQISQENVKIRLMRARLMLREKLTRVLGDAAQATPPHRH